jgi:GTP-binding protein
VVSFVDQVQVYLNAGRGGDGCVSVKREKFKPLGGPDGGNGGNGGNIFLRATEQANTLLDYHHRPHRKSENGGYGAGDFRNGTLGKDLVLEVPVGTVIKDDQENVLADLKTPGEELLAAEGGYGGLGNAALSSQKRKAPGFALLGTSGQECTLTLELKTIADVALVGYPSAGKSSLIAAMSAAKPKIADYPFTTLHPNLGVIDQGEHRFTVADVPGLIEGASEGRGLGLNFLRHVERCSALLHVIDCATLESNRDPVSDLDVILDELRAYPVPEGQTPLAERPQVVALNKIDVPEARELAEFVRDDIEARGFRVFLISTATREGLRELGFALAEIVESHRHSEQASQQTPERIVLRPKPTGRKREFEVRVEGGTYGDVFRVLGKKPERWVEQTDFANDEAVGYLADRLQKLGVEDALVKAGAVSGSTVVIGPGRGVVFDWEPSLTSAADVQIGVRGSDDRLYETSRRTNKQRRDEYHEMMNAKATAREELEREREAGMWKDGDE